MPGRGKLRCFLERHGFGLLRRNQAFVDRYCEARADHLACRRNKPTFFHAVWRHHLSEYVDCLNYVPYTRSHAPPAEVGRAEELTSHRRLGRTGTFRTGWGIAGEMAAEGARGPGTLQVLILDALYCLTQQDLESRIRLGS